MDYLNAIIQGIIQGLTEFLPVSSSGHLALYQILTGSQDENALLLDIVLHLGTLIAVFICFRQKIWVLILEFISMLKDIFKGKFFKIKMNPERRMIVMLIISLLVLIPFYPFKDYIEKASSYPVLLGFCFIYTSIILFLSDRVSDEKTTKTEGQIMPKNALVVGLFQAIALFPGISRSGSTICGGLFQGFNKKLAVEYSFILGIPTILASCLLEIADFAGAVADGTATMPNIPAYLIGFIVSGIVGVLAIKMVNWIVNSKKFIIFSIYTFILGIFTLIFGIVRILK